MGMIIFSDAHFPAHSMGPQVIRADGLRVSDLLQAIIPLFELDSYAPPLVMMAAVEGDALDPQVESAIARRSPQALPGYRPDRPLCLLRAGAKSLCDRYHRRAR
jgi:L-fucose mutarotase